MHRSKKITTFAGDMKRDERDERSRAAILEYLHAKGITQQQLANMLGMAQGNVSRGLKNWHIGGKFEMDVAWCLGLGLDKYIFGDEPDTRYPIPDIDVFGLLQVGGKTTKITNMGDLLEMVDMAQVWREWHTIINRYCACARTEGARRVWTFRKGTDPKGDVAHNSLGNMCSGFPFRIPEADVIFLNSECAYIAGLFSDDTEEHFDIQRTLLNWDNGFTAKKEVRQHNAHLARKDWEEWNVEWMRCVVWQKVKQNADFQKLLRATGDATIIENTSHMNAKKTDFWGAKNKEWLRAYRLNEAMKKYRLINDTQRAECEALFDYCSGKWNGTNMMGRILMDCREALIRRKPPVINYDLLRQKNIYILGKRLTFQNK